MCADRLLMQNASCINEADDSHPAGEPRPRCVSEMSVCSDVTELDLLELEQWSISLQKAAFGDRRCTVTADQKQNEQKSAGKTRSCDTEAMFSGLQLVASLPSQIARQFMYDVRHLPSRRRGRGIRYNASQTIRGYVHLRGCFEETATVVHRALRDGISQVIQSTAAKTLEVTLPRRKRSWDARVLLVVKPNASTCLEFEVIMSSAADKFEAIDALRCESQCGGAKFLLPRLADSISSGSAIVKICV